MPWKPKSPCRYPGCPALPDGPYCPAHQRTVSRARGSAASRGYGRRWRRRRAEYLRRHPLCAACEADGGVTPATVVDHKVPHRGDPALMWDETNWQALCKAHHDSKTATDDGGFGRLPQS